MPEYPIELDLRGRTTLVVGLGRVGRRKVAGLLTAGAHVIGIDPGIDEQSKPAGIELRSERYHARHLEGVAIAIAAATPDVNRQVVTDARAAGIWVCSASEPAEGDFSIPAVWREGLLTLTVSTSGTSPGLATLIRDRAASAIQTSAPGLLALLAELRPQVVTRIADPELRRELFTDWADARWLTAWDDEGPDAVRRELIARLEEAARTSRA